MNNYYLDDFFHHPDIANHPAYSLVKFLVTQWQNGNTLQNRQGTSPRQGGLGGFVETLRGISSRQGGLGALASSPIVVSNTSSFTLKLRVRAIPHKPFDTYLIHFDTFIPI